jgi:hypothetical protein
MFSAESEPETRAGVHSTGLPLRETGAILHRSFFVPPIYRFLIPTLVVCTIAPLRAQELPPLKTASWVASAGIPVTLSLPVAPTVPAKIGLYDLGGQTPLSEMDARFVPVPGGVQAVIRVEADPGTYEVRLVSADKDRKPLAAPARLTVPGLRREAGWWLLNGSLFSVPAVESAAATSLISGLARGGKVKFPVLIPSVTTEPMAWRTLPLPPLTDMAVPGYDFAKLSADLRARLAAPGGPALGFSLTVRPEAKPAGAPAVELTPAQKKAIVASLRTTLNGVAPGAALILDVDGQNIFAADDIDDLAPSCDAVMLRYHGVPPESALWSLKVARRAVEEQPDYDLPVFVNYDPQAGPPADRFLFDCLMGGATGFVLPPGYRPAWAGLVESNFPLFVGAVTLEDSPLPLLHGSYRFYEPLREGGRIPLLGRLARDDKNSGDPLMLLLDKNTDQMEIEGIKRAATQGLTMYIEGVPDVTKPELLKSLGELTGTTITALPKPVTNQLTLQDPWLFGTARGLEFPVQQIVSVKTKPSLAAQTRAQRGLDNITAPRFAGQLADDPAGIVVYGVGKGRVIWLPHPISIPNAETSLWGPPAPKSAADLMLDSHRASYYAALAGTMQSALVRVTPAKDTDHAPLAALRLSKGKTSLLALFNDQPTPVTANVATRGLSEAVIDLGTGQDLKSSQYGYETSFQITVPANGWSLVALNDKRKDYDKERSSKSGRGSVK